MPHYGARDFVAEAEKVLDQEPRSATQERDALRLLIAEIRHLKTRLAKAEKTALEACQAASNLDHRTRGLKKYG